MGGPGEGLGGDGAANPDEHDGIVVVGCRPVPLKRLHLVWLKWVYPVTDSDTDHRGHTDRVRQCMESSRWRVGDYSTVTVVT